MEQVFLEGDVDQGGGVAPVPGGGIVERDFETVAVSKFGIMAGRTARGPVTGQPPVEEELLAELNLRRRLGVQRRDRDVPARLQLTGESARRQAEHPEEYPDYSSHSVIFLFDSVLRQ